MARRKGIKYICPNCYCSVDLLQVHYACTDPMCTKTFLETCSETEAKRYASTFVPEEEVDVERSEFLGQDPCGPSATTTKYHIIRGSLNGTCDICKEKNTIRLCPNCHSKITESADKIGTSVYAVLGSEGSGKSHYVASLVHVMKNSYSEEFGMKVSDAGIMTPDNYEARYGRYVLREGKCVAPTPSYDDKKARVPLMYDISDEDGNLQRTLAIFDTSGNDLDSTDKLATLNISSYIAGSAGIIYVIDPLQLPKVRERLGLTPLVKNPDIAERLNYIAEIIRDNNKMKPKEDIDIPLAVVITKIDMLVRSPERNEDEDALFGPESALHLDRNKGEPELDIMDQIGVELEEYLRRNAGQEILDEINKFTTHQIFAVSAIGSDPVDGVLTKGIAPYRVEDPLIWFLTPTDRRKWF